MSNALNGRSKIGNHERASLGLKCDYRRRLSGLKRVIKDFVLENAYLCDEVAQVHEDILVLKEERRFLLKKLHHLEASAGIESTLQPGVIPSADIQGSASTAKKSYKRKAYLDTPEDTNGFATSQISKQKFLTKNKVPKDEQFDVDCVE